MLKNRMIALMVAVFLVCSTGSALAQTTPTQPDPCAPDVLAALTTSAQEGFDNLNELVTNIMKPPQSAASSDCMRNLFNVWDIDLIGTIGGVVANMINSVLPYSNLLPGITLTQSSVYAPIMGLVNDMLDKNLGSLVCQDLWKGVRTAMGPVTINADGTFGVAGPAALTFDSSTGEISIP